MPSSFPDSVIIVGAGVFGLSTALAIERRFPTTLITVIDRLMPPVVDGTSVDTSRVIRPDYVYQAYERLAVKSQTLIKNDPYLAPHYFERGFAFCTDGKPGELDTLWNQMFDKVKTEQPKQKWQNLANHGEIFDHLHRSHATPVSEGMLGRQRS
ncbi:hypothetical protein SLS55_000958 [Diplodia seriata]|uniref:FAD dependent oxidoreductase domain-containing protein n=1 Tax=Diplodia seriata TaxID=420778 RepID=A0ABR3CVS5_9PEZI